MMVMENGGWWMIQSQQNPPAFILRISLLQARSLISVLLLAAGRCVSWATASHPHSFSSTAFLAICRLDWLTHSFAAALRDRGIARCHIISCLLSDKLTRRLRDRLSLANIMMLVVAYCISKSVCGRPSMIFEDFRPCSANVITAFWPAQQIKSKDIQGRKTNPQPSTNDDNNTPIAVLVFHSLQ